MFERFTDRARSIVVTARAEAGLADVHYIGTEHLLAAMLAIGEGHAYDTLQANGLTLAFVRAETARILGTSAGSPGTPFGVEDAVALKTIGIDLDAVMESVEGSFGPGALSQVDRDHRRRSAHIPFTKRAKKVLELSLREALRLDHNYIGTEHILLGLIREGDGVGVKVLVNAGLDIEAMRDAIVADLGEPSEPKGRIGLFAGVKRFTPSARKTISSAAVEARRLGVDYIGTEHILLALTGSEAGTASRVLSSAGLTADDIRAAVVTRGPTLRSAVAELRKHRGRPTLTPRARTVLELAQQEAARSGQHRTGSEHLLLGILSEGRGMAVDILRQAGISTDDLRASLRTGLGEAA